MFMILFCTKMDVGLINCTIMSILLMLYWNSQQKIDVTFSLSFTSTFQSIIHSYTYVYSFILYVPYNLCP